MAYRYKKHTAEVNFATSKICIHGLLGEAIGDTDTIAEARELIDKRAERLDPDQRLAEAQAEIAVLRTRIRHYENIVRELNGLIVEAQINGGTHDAETGNNRGNVGQAECMDIRHHGAGSG